MNLHTVESHLDRNLHNTACELAQDLRAEAKHIVDPSQCGFIVRRHMDGISFGVLGLVAAFLAVATAAIAIVLR